ncbi:MAG: divalent-cation tolerance protein CutA [Asticcacaulis sp.]
MTEILIVSIACGSATEADKLAQMLVSLKLAACVQSQPVRSTYLWQGTIEQADEVLLTAKTTADKWLGLEALVRANHSYEVPEIIATRAEGVSQPYADWLKEVLA